jgi:hypothetical protein
LIEKIAVINTKKEITMNRWNYRILEYEVKGGYVRKMNLSEDYLSDGKSRTSA